MILLANYPEWPELPDMSGLIPKQERGFFEFANSIRQSAERGTCSLTSEDAGQHRAESSASGSEMQDSWAPLALRILTYFQKLERHSTTLHFTVKGVRKALKSELSRQAVQPLISTR